MNWWFHVSITQWTDDSMNQCKGSMNYRTVLNWWISVWSNWFTHETIRPSLHQAIVNIFFDQEKCFSLIVANSISACSQISFCQYLQFLLARWRICPNSWVTSLGSFVYGLTQPARDADRISLSFPVPYKSCHRPRSAVRLRFWRPSTNLYWLALCAWNLFS